MASNQDVFAVEQGSNVDGDELDYDCERGPAYRIWKRNALEHCRGKYAQQNKSDRYSFRDAFLRRDEGGSAANAPGLPPVQVNNNPIPTRNTRRRQPTGQSASRARTRGCMLTSRPMQCASFFLTSQQQTLRSLPVTLGILSRVSVMKQMMTWS